MQSRRSLLARIAAGAGVLGVGSVAGCVEQPSDADEPSDPPAYAGPLYDPTTVVSGPAPARAFCSYDLATLYERRDLFPDRLVAALDRADRSTEAVSLADLERATALGYWGYEDPEAPTAGSVAGGGSLLVRGSFEPDRLLERVRSEVEDGATVEAAGRVRGLDLYVLDSEREQAGSVALGLGEERVVAGGTARVDATGEDAARATVTGDAGYYDAGDTARRLLDATDDPTAVVGAEFEADRYAPDSFEGVPAGESLAAVVRGLQGVTSAMTLGEETVSRTVVGVYAEGERPARSDVTALLDLARQGVATRSESVDVEAVQGLIDDTEVTVEDRTVVAEVRRETDALFDGGGDATGFPGGLEAAVLLAPGVGLYGSVLAGLGPSLGSGPGDDTPTPPQAGFDLAYDADAGEVTITHTGGEAFTGATTERLLVRSGDRPPVPWELPVSAGDSVTVPAESGDSVFVAWEPAEGDVVQIVAQFEVP